MILVHLQLTEITRKLARRKYPEKNQFTSSADTMYAPVDSYIFKVTPLHDRRCREDIPSGSKTAGSFGPGQTHSAWGELQQTAVRTRRSEDRRQMSDDGSETTDVRGWRILEAHSSQEKRDSEIEDLNTAS